MLLKVLSFITGRAIEGERGLVNLIIAREGSSLNILVEGIAIELKSGTRVTLPIGLFDEQDRRVLQQGWDAWVAARENEVRKQEESTLLRSAASEYLKDQDAERRIQWLQLASQWADLWQVEIIRPDGRVTFVNVMARNSAQAGHYARRQCPGCLIGWIRRIDRRGY